MEMAPRVAPHSGCPGHPTLPCLSPAPQGTGVTERIFQALLTQTDTTIALIYKICLLIGVRIPLTLKE